VAAVALLSAADCPLVYEISAKRERSADGRPKT